MCVCVCVCAYTQTVWYYPLEVFVDKDLFSGSRYVKSDGEYGKAARIVRFSGAKNQYACFAHTRARARSLELTQTVMLLAQQSFTGVCMCVCVCVHVGSKALIRRSDGVLVTAATSPYPLMIYDMFKKAQWDKATRLCRFIKVREGPLNATKDAVAR